MQIFREGSFGLMLRTFCIVLTLMFGLNSPGILLAAGGPGAKPAAKAPIIPNPLPRWEKLAGKDFKTDLFANGKPRATYLFKDGRLDGRVVKYYSNGKISRVFHFTRGVPSCQWYGFGPNGKLTWQRFYYPCRSDDGSGSGAQRMAPIEIRYKYVCTFSARRPLSARQPFQTIRCKPVAQALIDTATFLPVPFQDDLFSSLNDVFDEASKGKKLNALVACDMGNGNKVAGAADIPAAEPDSGSVGDGVTGGFGSDGGSSAGGGSKLDAMQQQTAQALAKGCQDAGTAAAMTASEGSDPNGPVSDVPGLNSPGGMFDDSAIGHAESILQAGIKQCRAREASKAQGPSVQSPSSHDEPKIAAVVPPNPLALLAAGALLGVAADEAWQQIKKAAAPEFGNCQVGHSETICFDKDNPNRIQIKNNETEEKKIELTLPGGKDKIVTTFLHSEDGEHVSDTQVDEYFTDGVKTKTVLTPLYYDKIWESRGDKEVKIKVKNEEKSKQQVIPSGNDDMPDGDNMPVDGAGTKLPHQDATSMCSKMEGFLRMCRSTQWSERRCQQFVQMANGCVADPNLINPGPEGDLACRAKSGKPELQDSRTAQCEQRGWYASYVGPDGNYSCEKPKPDMSSLMRDRCDDPRTMCSPEQEPIGPPSGDGTGPTSPGPKPAQSAPSIPGPSAPSKPGPLSLQRYEGHTAEYWMQQLRAYGSPEYAYARRG